jgi:hypothetical protein
VIARSETASSIELTANLESRLLGFLLGYPIKCGQASGEIINHWFLPDVEIHGVEISWRASVATPKISPFQCLKKGVDSRIGALLKYGGRLVLVTAPRS